MSDEKVHVLLEELKTSLQGAIKALGQLAFETDDARYARAIKTVLSMAVEITEDRPAEKGGRKAVIEVISGTIESNAEVVPEELSKLFKAFGDFIDYLDRNEEGA